MQGVILVAAGAGERFGGPKVFAALEGRPLLEWAALPFYDFPDRVVVIREEDRALVTLKDWKIVPGGARRRDSVRAGLDALDPQTEIVLVHDAARPLVSQALVERVARAARAGGAAVPVVPVRDTIKRVEGDAIVQTLQRSELRVAQTPQGFRVELLRKAHAASDRDASDDALLVEDLGAPVAAVAGDPRNIKVTTPADLAVACALMEAPGR